MAQLNETPTMIAGPPQEVDVNQLRNYVANIAEIVAKLAKDLDYIINGNLDVNNIRANSITATALDVQELSAITANMGTLTAGTIIGAEIYGTDISTNQFGYPKTRMSASENLFSAEAIVATGLSGVYIEPEDTFLGVPAIVFKTNGTAYSSIYNIGGSTFFESPTGNAFRFMNSLTVGNPSGISALVVNGQFRINSNIPFGLAGVSPSDASTLENVADTVNAVITRLQQMGVFL